MSRPRLRKGAAPAGRTTRVRTLAGVAWALLAAAGCDQFEDPDIAQIQSLEPDSGAIGSVVVIEAQNLLDDTVVIFEDEKRSPVNVLFQNPERVVTIVPQGAATGDVRLETGGERSSSRFPFTVIPAPPTTPAFFEDDTGSAVSAFLGGCAALPSDDGYVEVPLPFAFPFYGRTHELAFVSTNGVITFADPRPCDNRGGTADFATADKIALVGFDLDPGVGGEIRVNAAGPDRVIVTWDDVALCNLPETGNTFQAVLFADGRIRMNFGYLSTRGIGVSGCEPDVFNTIVTGSVTGITPLAPASLTQVTYSTQAPLTVAPREAVVNRFFVDRFFDLQNRSLLFTPLEEGGVFSGYRVELLPEG
ncbi:MAG: hypothetical protein H0V09_09880 [Gemmatimonadetes bacterium]|nr:hypothetical protein [Gemmatimonadota bacterium]